MPVVARTSIAGRTVALLRAHNAIPVRGAVDNATTILKGVELAMGRDKYVSIVDASGSGESTFLYLRGGPDRPTRSMAGADGKEVPFDTPSWVLIDEEDTSE